MAFALYGDYYRQEVEAGAGLRGVGAGRGQGVCEPLSPPGDLCEDEVTFLAGSAQGGAGRPAASNRPQCAVAKQGGRLGMACSWAGAGGDQEGRTTCSLMAKRMRMLIAGSHSPWPRRPLAFGLEPTEPESLAIGTDSPRSGGGWR